ncbi:MAG: hypothetical protein FJ318_10370 [SAR202 cluster bacterium]|nr:hypothetical protein [SAR202 cluster bacterium]
MRKRGELAGLAPDRLRAMADAGPVVEECYRVLRKTRDNVVSELLRHVEDFREFDHYPEGDVFDAETHAQYYYHAHAHAHGGDPRLDEHGHFHTFLRRPGMPADALPLAGEAAESIAHLVAVSINRAGYPVALFTTNRWVTGETWYGPADVCRMLPRFAIDHARPSWPVNRWLTAMLSLFAPEAEDLLLARDQAVATHRARHPTDDVLEDRRLEITALARISVEQRLRDLKSLLADARQEV